MPGSDILLLAFFGLFAGVIAGFFGVGGGIIFTPLLFFLFGEKGIQEPVAWAIGSSLFCTFTASLSSSVQQYRKGNLHPADGVRVGLFGMAGVWAGKQITLSSFYSEGVFVTFFALMLAFVAVSFYIRPHEDPETDEEKRSQPPSTALGWIQAVKTGGVGGFIAALAGVGGGVAMVPIMNLAIGMRLSKAVSISSLAIVFISLSGWIQFALGEPAGSPHPGWTVGYIDFATVLPMALTTMVGGFAGVSLGRRVPESVASIGYAILTMTIAIVMVARIL